MDRNLILIRWLDASIPLYHEASEVALNSLHSSSGIPIKPMSNGSWTRCDHSCTQLRPLINIYT